MPFQPSGTIRFFTTPSGPTWTIDGAYSSTSQKSPFLVRTTPSVSRPFTL